MNTVNLTDGDIERLKKQEAVAMQASFMLSRWMISSGSVSNEMWVELKRLVDSWEKSWPVKTADDK